MFNNRNQIVQQLLLVRGCNIMIWKRISIICFVIACVSVPASGETINVPGDQPTIQTGIDAASNGDTVLVADGTYSGTGNRDIDFNGKAIAVTSVNGPDQTVIDCEDLGRGFYFHSNEDENSILEGFSITNGYLYNEDGAGINCYGSAPCLHDLVITNCYTGGYGGGINCKYASPIIENVTFEFDSAWAGGGGLACYMYSSPILQNSIFTENASYIGGGGIVCNVGSSPTIENVVLQNNLASLVGGGLMCAGASCAVLSNVTITGNTAFYSGGGVYSTQAADIVLQDVTITNNTALQSNGGGAFFVQDVSPALTNVTITGNSAVGAWAFGGGISCADNANVSLIDVIISDNSVGNPGADLVYGGGIECQQSDMILENVIISGNSAVGSSEWVYGGGIIITSSDPILNNVEITDNTAEYGGGILCWEFGTSPDPELTDVTFSKNIANVDGGGLYCLGDCNPALLNCILWNDAPQEIAAGKFSTDASGISSIRGVYVVEFDCCPFSYEIPVFCIQVPDRSLVAGDFIAGLPDCIEITEIPADSRGYEPLSVSISYSDIQGGWTGTGNIDADPLFADPPGGDFQLTWVNYPDPDTSKSPCIDAGDPSSPFDPDGTVADMGAYYFDQVYAGSEDFQAGAGEGLLRQNNPNPFNSSTTIRFITGISGMATVSVYDISGRQVETLVDDILPAGEHSVTWNCNDSMNKKVCPGIYFCRLETADGYRDSRTMLLIR
jgi:predicted outer membrane repeat protein